MTNKEQDKVTRSKEITENYFQFLDNHIEDVVLGKTDEFMEINQIASALFISHKHLTDTVQKETGSHPCHFYDLKILDEAKKMLLETDKSISGYFGVTMPVISVKPCHSKRSYNYI